MIKFEEVQTIIKENASKLEKKKKRNYIFTGLIQCPLCRRKMCGNSDDRYICSRYRHDMRCGFGISLKEKVLEDYIKKNLKIDIQKYESLSVTDKNDYLKSIIEQIIPSQNLKNFKIILKNNRLTNKSVYVLIKKTLLFVLKRRGLWQGKLIAQTN